MKIIAALLILFLASKSFSQVNNGSYRFKNTIPESQLKADDKIADALSFDLVKGAKVEVINYSERDNTITFKYWNYSQDTNLHDKYNGTANNKYFTLPLDFFLQNTARLYRRYKGANVGIYTIPFRLRNIGKETFDYETSLSLQANVVFGFGTIYNENSWLDLSAGVGITGINLNSENSDVSENRTASAVTFSLGALLKPEQFVNIGFFIGTDMLGQKDSSTNWIHNNRIWYGVGINIGFTRISTSSSPNPKNQE